MTGSPLDPPGRTLWWKLLRGAVPPLLGGLVTWALGAALGWLGPGAPGLRLALLLGGYTALAPLLPRRHRAGVLWLVVAVFAGLGVVEALWRPGAPPLAALTLTTVCGALLLEGAGAAVLALWNAVEDRHEAVVDAQQALGAAQRAKDQFLANMSHELRTPLNAVIGYTELVLEDLDEATDPDAVRDLQRVDAAARHLLGLISGILELTQVDVDVTIQEITPVDLGELLRECIRAVGADLERGDNELVLEAPVDAPVRLGTDLTRLARILSNLLSNAAKFTDHGRIVVRWEQTATGARVEVEDTGPGIPAEEIERVFERFEQLDASSTRTRGGAGLGLALTRRMVRQLHGEIAVTSALGRGTRFVVDLPDLTPEAAEAEAIAK